ncbi:hypothetical protein [Ammoniphilus resinae]|uniref:Uncharacterized protein n=1 Tax=Ammoniphilus resinae TaxID=861532 RepID=A0ABS4GXM5_9BACL|nr:hypothetical protein [Ammoniphilus resinae]MBP1935025.1 hypothetical protein [Ammoniphilus resinae]
MKWTELEFERLYKELVDEFNICLEDSVKQMELMSDFEARNNAATVKDRIDLYIKVLNGYKAGLDYYIDMRENDANLLNRIYQRDMRLM